MPSFPERNANAITGSQFIQKIMNFKSGSPERNRLIFEEINSGNFPSFLRKFVPIKVEENNISIIYYVSSDYMSIGSDQDFIRISMDGPLSQKVADRFNCILPTKKMVDQIYNQAKTKAKPAPMSGGAKVGDKFYSGKEFINLKMQHADSLEEHNRMVQRQLNRINHSNGNLVAGIKKDVVIGNLLNNKKDKVNIYGWHTENGKAIQPESTIHESTYYDYSHGTRLVDINCQLIENGKTSNKDIRSLLKDKKYSSLIAYETLTNTSYNKEEKKDVKNEEKNISRQQNNSEINKIIDEYLSKVAKIHKLCNLYYKSSCLDKG